MSDLPAELLDPVRAICLSLPEVYEETAWIGVRWRVRKRTIAHLLTVDEKQTTVLKGAFRARGRGHRADLQGSGRGGAGAEGGRLPVRPCRVGP